MCRKVSDVPNVRVIKFRHETATAVLCDWGDGTSSLGYVYARAKGQGHAKSLMAYIVDYVETNHIRSIYIEVDGYGPKNKKALTNEQLVGFYAKFGFVVDRAADDAVCMERISTLK
jgi:GNAT superfamily N-acetyltransferase